MRGFGVIFAAREELLRLHVFTAGGKLFLQSFRATRALPIGTMHTHHQEDWFGMPAQVGAWSPTPAS